MQRRKNLHAGTEERMVSDSHFAYIEHDAIEVKEYARAQMDIATIVAEERRLHPYGVATGSEKISEDASSLCSLRLTCAVERKAQVSCAFPRFNEFGVKRVVQLACQHSVALAAHVDRS